jgi:serine protease AprX
MDSIDGSTFQPDAIVTRADAARVLASDCWIRQNQINAPVFTDVPDALVPFVQALTSAGGPMRDTFMQGGPVLDGAAFSPNSNVTRAQLAVWLVRALGKEADAIAAMNTPTTFTDDNLIPPAFRGYIVVASNIGLMPGFANQSVEGAPVTYYWKPIGFVSRGALALTIDKWWDIFMTP